MFEDSRLKIFLTVSRTGNFTKAAKELGISQPAVSQSIAQLERDLGRQLFTRAKGEVVPTAVALSFKSYAEQILHWYSAASEMFGPEGAALSGKPVRVGADDFLAAYVLPPVIGGLMATDRKLRMITVPYGQEAEISVSLARRDGRLDFSGSLVGVMQAVAVTSSRGGMKAGGIASSWQGVHGAASFREGTASGSVAPGAAAMAAASSQRGTASGSVTSGAAMAAASSRGTKAGSVASSRQGMPASLSELPEGTSFAVWEPYEPYLPLDAVPRVSVRSASVGLLKSLLASDSALVGILPQPSCEGDGFLRLPNPLPYLQLDIHLQAPDNAIGLRFSQLLSDSLR